MKTTNGHERTFASDREALAYWEKSAQHAPTKALRDQAARFAAFWRGAVGIPNDARK